MKKAQLLCCIMLCAMFSIVGAADWPQWRGPGRTGDSPETGLLKEWPKEGPELLWQLNNIGDGYGAPTIVGSRVYLLSNKGMDNEYVQALSLEDGQPLWARKLGKVGKPDQKPPYPKARSTPTIEGQFLFALGSDGDLACLETGTGKLIWRRNLRRDFGGEPGIWAYSESPLIDEERVVVTPGGGDATLVALDKTTGETLWKSAIPDGGPAGYSSAVVIEAAGRRQYVQFMEKGLVGVDAETGQFLWRYTGMVGGPANIPTPVTRGDVIYNANPRRVAGALIRIKSSQNKIVAEEVYLQRGLPNDIGGQVLVGENLYGTHPEGGLICVEFQTGKILWKAESIGSSSILYADGHVYLHGENGDVALVEANAERYREKGRFTPPNPPEHTGGAMEKAWAYPVIAEGRLFIRDLTTLWCYDIKTK